VNKKLFGCKSITVILLLHGAYKILIFELLEAEKKTAEAVTDHFLLSGDRSVNAPRSEAPSQGK